MNKVKIVFLCLILFGVIGYACKKEPVDSKLFVERYLTGKWPLKLQITMVIKNNTDTIVPSDSTLFTTPNDTGFTETQQFIRGTSVVNFNIDAEGENITFAATPDSTWHIEHARKNSFKIIYTRKETVGTDIIDHVLTREFNR